MTVNILSDEKITGKVKPVFSTGKKEERGLPTPPLDSNETTRKQTGYAVLASSFLFLETPGIHEINRRHSLFSQTTSSALALQIEL
jgi:hypothetical protein